MQKVIFVLKNIVFLGLLSVLLVLTLALISQKKQLLGINSYIVLSGSMSPTFSAGDLIFSVNNNAQNFQKNEIIMYKDENIPGKIITHRIVTIDDTGGKKVFTTKGDANNEEDSKKVNESQILGKYLFSVPKMGYFINFAKTAQGFLLLILIPGIIIIGSEIWGIIKYFRSLELRSQIQNAKI